MTICMGRIVQSDEGGSKCGVDLNSPWKPKADNNKNNNNNRLWLTRRLRVHGPRDGTQPRVHPGQVLDEVIPSQPANRESSLKSNDNT